MLGIRGLAVLLSITANVLVAGQKGQGADGNPHGWDRQRRCDHSQYSPPCGICEGIGGIPYGDDNDQIHLTTCVPVSTTVDPATLKPPVWARTWATDSYEVLIGPKTDPFCFTTIPSNTSEGALCYRGQTGVQHYDFAKTRALREDINVYSVVGNVTTTFIHQGQNLWIVNKFPWYAAGVHQCVCTHAREGGAGTSSNGIWPVATNWTSNLGFVGRENITVEYDQGTHTLDHWAFGPHHVWAYPETGRILRMWQPFNGLQVFPNGTSSAPVDPALFSDMPPDLCKKKNGALFRVKCADDGYPNDVNSSATDMATETIDTAAADTAAAATGNSTNRSAAVLELVAVLNGTAADTAAAAPAARSAEQEQEQEQGLPTIQRALSVIQQAADGSPSVSDKRRAYTAVPRHAFRGQSFEDMSNVLNSWLERSPGVSTKACDDWNVAELQQLQTLLHALRHVELDQIYQQADDNRKLSQDLDAMQEEWEILNHLADMAEDSDMANQIRRDGHCHEAVMWYTHHLTADVKRAVADSGLGLTIPLLSTTYHVDDDDVQRAVGSDEHMARVMGMYEEQVTCLSCHADVP